MLVNDWILLERIISDFGTTVPPTRTRPWTCEWLAWVLLSSWFSGWFVGAAPQPEVERVVEVESEESGFGDVVGRSVRKMESLYVAHLSEENNTVLVVGVHGEVVVVETDLDIFFEGDAIGGDDVGRWVDGQGGAGVLCLLGDDP
ncbi:hypothetical protein DFH07DRAFT_940348 [Mycena maculata]|uniref:Uncharacterized protein n=1 Tax=Mycena maculata TaxID=230809 RepID=A0AAD7NFK5_9AGAR|nr:hypothetical protein DFH07DRAFT_940348 [Mycena maculata]